MADSVASHVKNIINRSPFISEMLIMDVISFSNLASFVQPKVEAAMGKSVKNSAIVMAIRRYADELKNRKDVAKKDDLHYEISMKTNIYDVNFQRNDDFVAKLSGLYEKVELSKGDFLNVTMGTHEISLAVSEKYRGVVDDLTKEEVVLHRKEDLVALTILFTGDFLQTPGILYLATRKLAWENINLIEIVSTMNELTFVISREDSMKAFSSLQSFFDDEL